MFSAPRDFSTVTLRQRELRGEVPRRSGVVLTDGGARPRSGRTALRAALGQGTSLAGRWLCRLERGAIGIVMLAAVLVLEWRLARLARA